MKTPPVIVPADDGLSLSVLNQWMDIHSDFAHDAERMTVRQPADVASRCAADLAYVSRATQMPIESVSCLRVAVLALEVPAVNPDHDGHHEHSALREAVDRLTY